MTDLVSRLTALLERGQDSAVLRFGLGQALLAAGEADAAAEHLRAAVRQDPTYSAAWKLLGKSLASTGDLAGAMQAYRDGIQAADARGDKQAAREMQVFLKRLEKG